MQGAVSSSECHRHDTLWIAPRPSDQLQCSRSRTTSTARCRVLHQFENNYATEMCSGSEVGSYLRLIDFVYHSTLGLRVMTERRRALHQPLSCSWFAWKPRSQTQPRWGCLGPYGGPRGGMPRALWWSQGGVLMSEVPLYWVQG